MIIKIYNEGDMNTHPKAFQEKIRITGRLPQSAGNSSRTKHGQCVKTVY
jgi:hypothetical protein